jgi:hypothetical protein
VAGGDVVGEGPERLDIAAGVEELKVPTRTWLAATRVRTAPG